MSDTKGTGPNPAQASQNEGNKRRGCGTIGVILVLLGLLALILALLGVFNAPGQARIQVVVVTDTPNQPATQPPSLTPSPVVRSNLDAEELAATNMAREVGKANATATAQMALVMGTPAAAQAMNFGIQPGMTCQVASTVEFAPVYTELPPNNFDWRGEVQANGYLGAKKLPYGRWDLWSQDLQGPTDRILVVKRNGNWVEIAGTGTASGQAFTFGGFAPVEALNCTAQAQTVNQATATPRG